MTHKVKVTEIPEVLEALRANREKNRLDEGVLNYPLTEILRCDPAVMPIHPVLMLESLGWLSEADAKTKLDSMDSLLKVCEDKAVALGIREMIFISSDPRTDAAAETLFGFEKVTCLRKKLPAR